MTCLTRALHTITDQTGTVGPVNCVRFNKTGEYFMTAGYDKVIKLYNAKRGTRIAGFSGSGREVLCLSISNQNDTFVSGAEDREVRLWDISTGTNLRRFSGHYEKITAVAMSADGQVVVSGSHDTKVRFWDIRGDGRKAISTLEDCKDTVSSLIMLESELLVSSIDGIVRAYDFRTGKLRQDNLYEAVTSLRVSSDYNCLLASCKDGVIRLLDKEEGGLLNHFSGHKNDRYRIESVFDNTDAVVISGSEDGNIFYWDLVEGTIIQRVKKHTRAVTTLDYSPKDGDQMLVSGSSDGKVIVWSN